MVSVDQYINRYVASDKLIQNEMFQVESVSSIPEWLVVATS